MKDIIIDMFCGAGGTSTGLKEAVQDIGGDIKLYAINHWEIAIETHSKNHPEATHFCQSVNDIDPRRVFKNKRIKLLIASPECTHHSNARGGKPRDEQSRAMPWNIIRWCSTLYIDSLLIENIPEFVSWGPLGVNGLPLKKYKGAEFNSWINALKALGYNVEYKILNCADYGDPTTRRRFFLQAKRGKKRKIMWPQMTHAKKPDFFCEKWVPAKDIIDWSIPCPSIFTRKKPLSKNTMDRIFYGLKKFNGEEFMVMLYGTSTARNINKPVPTVTANGQHIAVCKPFIVRSGWGTKLSDINNPVPTLMTKGHLGICTPFYIRYNGKDKKAYSLDKPLLTVTTRDRFALIKPFLISYYGRSDSVHSIEKPIPTVTCENRFALIKPDLLDIGYRMLAPHELSKAMSFPDDYFFHGTKTQIVKQIGNAVPVKTAKALIMSLLLNN